MKQYVPVTEAVDIRNSRVKPFAGKRRYLATGDLSRDEINDLVSVDYKTKPSRADLLVCEGEIIVARMQATNKVLLIDKNTQDLIVSTGFMTLSPRNGFDASYLTHYFRSNIFERQKDKYCSGATQKAINNGAFKKLQIPRYALKEQKKIAEILDLADFIRQRRQQSLQLLDEFLRASFFDLFGDLDSKKSQWLIKNLGNICDVVSGVTKGRKFDQERTVWVPYMRVANVQDGFINVNDLKKLKFFLRM
jgi:type I restriction enzyme S subunit